MIGNYTTTTTSGVAFTAYKRTQCVITNTGSNAVFLNFGSTAEVSKGIYLAAGGTFIMDGLLSSDDDIHAITSTGTSNIAIYYI